MNRKNDRLTSSFKDPSGFIFKKDGVLYRQINPCYFEEYNFFKSSMLYDALVKKKYLVSHEEVETDKDKIIIKPEHIDFILYPYEMSFSQLKDAALLTLRIQKTALEHDMTLKDASNYNVTYHNNRPIFIDTLSFDKYTEGEPWVAFGQFCRHYLSTLLLMKYNDLRLNSLLKIFLDGIPLDLAVSLLPKKTRFNLSIYLNIHLHAKMIAKNQGNFGKKPKLKVKKVNQSAMIESLISFVKSLKIDQDTEWKDYYSIVNYSENSFFEKENIVKEYLSKIKPGSVLDLGANDGHFSRLAGGFSNRVLSCDIDMMAVEKNYLNLKKEKNKQIIPFFMDISNPSPSIGFFNKERDSLISRLTGIDAVMALALIHHLAITYNIPFFMLAEFFSSISRYLIIEFIKPGDSWADSLINSKDRPELFDFYNQNNFEKDFGFFYKILEKKEINDSSRIMYLMETKKD